jgi:hypothetical protein
MGDWRAACRCLVVLGPACLKNFAARSACYLDVSSSNDDCIWWRGSYDAERCATVPQQAAKAANCAYHARC